jgi:hypothetical protein
MEAASMAVRNIHTNLQRSPVSVPGMGKGKLPHLPFEKL